MNSRIPMLIAGLIAVCGAFAVDTANAQSYSASVDTALVSKYIWRGQRLTNDWSFQPSLTVGAGGFAFNAWGTMDLTKVNEGDELMIPENPASIPGDNDGGLQGHFSEVDYTFSYDHSFEHVSLGGGVIVYTFPQRASSLATTEEIYGSISFDSVPLAPSATLYIDVDETGDNDSAGLYFLLAAGQSIPTGNAVMSSIDLAASLSFANSGFGNYYYGLDHSGPHDFSFSVSAPITINDNWSFGAFITYSALLGDYRDGAYGDPRTAYLGTSGTPRSFADTIWGGFTMSLTF